MTDMEGVLGSHESLATAGALDMEKFAGCRRQKSTNSAREIATIL